jgi:hypothetical protein
VALRAHLLHPAQVWMAGTRANTSAAHFKEDRTKYVTRSRQGRTFIVRKSAPASTSNGQPDQLLSGSGTISLGSWREVAPAQDVAGFPIRDSVGPDWPIRPQSGRIPSPGCRVRNWTTNASTSRDTDGRPGYTLFRRQVTEHRTLLGIGSSHRLKHEDALLFQQVTRSRTFSASC